MTLDCLGCAHIATQGGGHWRDGEPHYVGCPTELEELRAECRGLRALVASAHEKFADVVSLLPRSSIVGEPTGTGVISAPASDIYRSPSLDGSSTLATTPKRKERTIDLLRRLHGGSWVYNPSSRYPYTQTNTGRRVYLCSSIPQFEDGDSSTEVRWEDTKELAGRHPW